METETAMASGREASEVGGGGPSEEREGVGGVGWGLGS